MNYYICSTSVFDNLNFKDEIIEDVPGGAGIYALVGARLWAENVQLVCGVGIDYVEKMGNWYRENAIPMDYLREVNYKTPVNEIYYDTEEERVEIPEFGVDHYKRFETKPEEFNQLIAQPNSAVYVFRNTEEMFWEHLLNIENKKAFILWEIAGDACYPSELEKIRQILKKVDVFSLNFEEASSIFKTTNYDEIIDNLHKLKVPLIFLRQGKRGQSFLKDGETVFVPSMQSNKVVDVTGGGNSSSGGVLVGASRNEPLEKIGEMANQSAILALSQLGIPDTIKNTAENIRS